MSALGRLASMARAVVERVSEVERAKPLPAAPHRVRTLGDFWTHHHLPYLQTQRVGTRRQHVNRWSKWIGPYFEDMTFEQIDAPCVAGFVAFMRKQHCNKDPQRPFLAVRSIHSIYATGSAMSTHAVSLGLMAANPFVAARRWLPEDGPSARNKDRPQRLNHNQAWLLMYSPQLPQEHRDEYAFAILTSARRGEIHGMRWRCVFLDASTPFVRIEKSHNGPTKTGVVREVPIHVDLMPILRRIHDERKPSPDDIVFPTASGGMQRQSSKHHLYASLRELGLPDIVFHSLRKTGATLYRAAGMSRDEVGDILGHAKTVTDTYAPSQLHVPEYAQTVVDCDVPEWFDNEDVEEEAA